MKDRVPLYPGRVKLTPVSGQENVYDMVRADQPTQEGDPLNKSTFLTDSTASLYGLGVDSVPDEVFQIIHEKTEKFGDIIFETTSYVGLGSPRTGITINFTNYPVLVMIFPTRPYYGYQDGGFVIVRGFLGCYHGATDLNGYLPLSPNTTGPESTDWVATWTDNSLKLTINTTNTNYSKRICNVYGQTYQVFALCQKTAV